MAIDMYLQVDGITGESQDSNHKGWIDIASYTWGSTQKGAMASGGGGGAGKVNFNDLSVATNMDCATPALLKYCANGKHISNIKLSFCKAGGTQIEYSTVVLKDVIVTNVQISGVGSLDQVALNYSFQASQVEHHYWVQSKDGTKGAETEMGWDVKANKATA
jgi:type VI secretion system secreted protein Hcp